MLSSSISVFGSVGGFVILMSFNLKKENNIFENHDRELKNRGPKGQIISECLFDFLNFPKKHRKI